MPSYVVDLVSIALCSSESIRLLAALSAQLRCSVTLFRFLDFSMPGLISVRFYRSDSGQRPKVPVQWTNQSSQNKTLLDRHGRSKQRMTHLPGPRLFDTKKSYYEKTQDTKPFYNGKYVSPLIVPEDKTIGGQVPIGFGPRKPFNP